MSREIFRNGVERGIERRWRRASERGGRAAARLALATDVELRKWVQARLERWWSPARISTRLAIEVPDRPELRVSQETIYQSLDVQGRAALRREPARCLRTGRASPLPPRQAQARRARRPLIPDLVEISERPAEAAARAIPGHWEGDLLIGKDNKSAIGTLVERTSRFCLLAHLPDGDIAPAVRDAMIHTRPTILKRSLTWDRGTELARHAEITLATDLAIYFCDPHAQWQRGSNENTWWCRVRGTGSSSTGGGPVWGCWVTRRTRVREDLPLICPQWPAGRAPDRVT